MNKHIFSETMETTIKSDRRLTNDLNIQYSKYLFRMRFVLNSNFQSTSDIHYSLDFLVLIKSHLILLIRLNKFGFFIKLSIFSQINFTSIHFYIIYE